jgi:hypothetical protein
LPKQAAQHSHFGAYEFAQQNSRFRTILVNRITGGGTHIGKADLSALRAQAYADKTDADTVLRLIQQTANEGGWLIFYSHEVRNEPGPWGTTPEQLEMACADSKPVLLPYSAVEKAIDFFNRNSPGSPYCTSFLSCISNLICTWHGDACLMLLWVYRMLTYFAILSVTISPSFSPFLTSNFMSKHSQFALLTNDVLPHFSGRNSLVHLMIIFSK